MKVYQSPPTKELNEGGIKRVCEAYQKYLPEFGIQFVNDDAEADLISSHAGSYSKPTVLHCHGLYWTSDYPDANRWEWAMNAAVISAIRYSKEVTVPSAWVAETFQRDMRFTPNIIPHGIEWQDWQHKEQNEGYILWNKNRIGDVCDPNILGKLADRFQDETFVTTYAPQNMHNTIASGKKDTTEMWHNIKITDILPHNQMKLMVQRAGVYLSTTKETFGLGVLEAMAAGVPVLGWRYGGNTQLIEHGVNGYLAEPNNLDDLFEGLNYCLQYRKLLGANGQELAKNWTWLNACQMVYNVYTKALEPEDHSVSVVIPVYNKTIEQVERAVESCLNQTLKPKEIIVIDDGSDTDYETLQSFGSQNYYPVTVIKQHNQGVAHARNNGIAQTTSTYICCLDSDDWIEPDYLKRCVNEIKQDRSLGIVFTGLRWHNPDGETGISQWPNGFDYDAQIARKNQIPTCCVFRREAWERIGGYKQRYAPLGAGSEDAAFWTMFGAIGYGARQITKKPLFNYSTGQGLVHGNPEYNEVDWLQMYPWTRDIKHPFASLAKPKDFSHPVRQYDEPIISIIIPVGTGHEKEVCNALDSIEMQHYRKWEVIVIWDFDLQDNEIINQIQLSYPYVRFRGIGASSGAGWSRNFGVNFARADLIFFLDADDVLSSPHTLDIMLESWQNEHKIIYSDYLVKASWGSKEEALNKLDDPTRLKGYLPKTKQSIISYQAGDYDCNVAQSQPKLSNNSNMPYYIWCLVSCLMPKKWFNEAGGFDESLDTWEDVELFWRMAKLGYCFHRVSQELILYNADSGNRREESIPKDHFGRQNHKNLIKYITDKHKDLEIMACGCQDDKKAITAEQDTKMKDNDFVRIEFWPKGVERGQSYGKHLKSPSGQRIGNNKLIDYGGYSRRAGDKFDVHIADQKARPDMFQLATVEIEVPKEEIITPEPVAIATANDTQEIDIVTDHKWDDTVIQKLYGKHSAKKLKGMILNYDENELEDLEYILEWEQNGKNRKSIIEAIQKRI